MEIQVKDTDLNCSSLTPFYAHPVSAKGFVHIRCISYVTWESEQACNSMLGQSSRCLLPNSLQELAR